MILVIIGAIIFAVSILYGWFVISYPDAGPLRPVQLAGTAEEIMRGKYLAHHVTACMDCHSERDNSGRIIPGSEGQGGRIFGENEGIPGTLYARNITPHDIGGWSNAEIAHAFTTGVGPDGGVIFPIMPYVEFGKMSLSDVAAIVAYLRTLQPIENEVPASKVKFPLSLFLRRVPRVAVPQMPPDRLNQLEYGRYLATVAACGVCHTPSDRGAQLEEMAYAGGFQFNLKSGVLRSANLTPDIETGIGSWDKQKFITVFRTAQPLKASNEDSALGGSAYPMIMPWPAYAGMTDEDLSAIYNFLQTVAPIKHPVETWSPSPQKD